MSLLVLATALAAAPAVAQQPVHSFAEARQAAAAAGFSGIGGFERRGSQYWTTAVDAEGNRVRVTVDERTGAISGVSVVEAGAHPPLPNPAPFAPPLVAPGIEPPSYEIRPAPPPRLPGIGGQRIGPPGPSWCQNGGTGPGC